MTRSDAVWVMVRGFGLFFAYRAIETLLELLKVTTYSIVYAVQQSRIMAQSRSDSVNVFASSIADFLMPVVFAAGQLVCFLVIARYLLKDGAMVHRWCTAAWSGDSRTETNESEAGA